MPAPQCRVWAALALATAVPAQDVFPYRYHVDDFANGFRVVTVPTDFPDLVNVQLVVSVGSRHEVEEGRSGFAHFFEHMMFRGSKNYTGAQRSAILKEIGADGNAYTNTDFTNYHVTIGKQDLETVLKLEADRFQFLQYERPAFRTEAMAVFGEYNKNSSSPINKLFEALQETAFDRHTYKHTTMGFLRDIVKMPQMYDYSLQFYDRFYRPENTTLLVVGDVQHEAVKALAEKYFAGWPRGTHKVEIPVEPKQTAPRQVHVPWPTPTQPWVVLAYKGPAFSSKTKEMAALDLMSTFAFGPDSAAYKKLYVEEQKITGLFPDFSNSTDPFLLNVFARLNDKADAVYVRDYLLTTCDALAKTPIPADDLARIKRNLRYGFAARLDSSEGIANALTDAIARTRTPATVNEMFARYDEVTAEDIMKVAATFLTEQGRTIATLAHGEEPLFPAKAAAKSPCDAVIQRTQSPLVSIRLVFRTGAADDPPGKKGLAQVTARMLAEGSNQKLSYAEMLSALFPMACGIDSQTDKQMTTLSATVHRDNLAAFWDIMLAAVAQPAFKQDDLDRIKSTTKSAIEVDLRGNNDEELGKEVLYTEIYDQHPFGHLNAGALADLDAITLDDVRGFWRNQLRADLLTVGLAGGFPEGFDQKVRQQLADALQGDPGKPAEIADLPWPRELARSRLTVVQKDTRATGIHIGFPIEVTRKHEDFVALWLVRSYLGEHRNDVALLYQRLREIRGLNYGDYAYIEYFPRGMFQFKPDPNQARTQQIFQIWIRPVPPQNGPFACRAAFWHLQQLVDKGLTEAEFESTRKFLMQRVATLVADQDSRLGYALDSAFYNRGDFVQMIRDGLRKLTVADVNRAIKQHLRTQRVQFVVVTQDAEAFVKGVFAEASPINYESAPPADVLAEDKVIERFPLGVLREDVRVVPVAEVFAK